MDKFDSDLQEIKVDIKQLLITSAKHQVVLDEHVRRTELAEIAIASLDKRTDMVEKRFFKIDGAAKTIGILVGLITFIDVVLKIMGHLKTF